MIGETGGILYNAATGIELAQTPIERGDARQLYNVGEGIGIASADRDDFIRLWAFARKGDSEPLWRGNYLAGPAIASDGGWAVTVTNEEIELTNLMTSESRPALVGSPENPGPEPGMIADILLGPEGRQLLWEDYDGNIHLANTAGDGEYLGQLPRLEESPTLTHFSLARDRLAALGSDQILRVWDTTKLGALDFTAPMTIAVPARDVQALALSPDGRWLATASSGSEEVQIWNLDDKSAPETVRVGGASQALALSDQGAQLAVMYATPEDPMLATRVTVWGRDSNTAQISQTAELRVMRALPTMGFGPPGDDETTKKYLITAQKGNEIATIYRQFLTVEALAQRVAEVADCRLDAGCVDLLFQRLSEQRQMRKDN